MAEPSARRRRSRLRPGRDLPVVRVEPPHVLVYYSERGRLRITWAITLTKEESDPGATRVRLRLRLAGVQRIWLAKTGGELIDLVTIAGMATGLAERLRTVLGAPDHT